MSFSSAQLAERLQGIGGSDAAAAVGLSPWKTPFELWQEKIGERAPDDLSDNERVRFGTLLEDVVADEFARRRGCRIQRVRSTLKHPERSFMFAHIDRRIVGAREGLECKTADLRMAKRWGEEETDEIPLEYWAQASHYLAVTGFDAWHVAVLIGGNTYRTYRVDRDEEAIAALVDRELTFWEHVKSGIAPDPVCLDDTRIRWPSHIEAKRSIATEAILTDVCTLADVRSRIAALETEKEALELRIKAHMADAAELVDAAGQLLCTWKQAKASQGFDAKRFAAEHPELHRQYLIERAGARRFLIKS